MESTESTKTTHTRKRHSWLLLLAVPVLLGAGFCAARAHAGDDGFGFGPPAFGGGTPEQHKAFMQRRLGKMLDMLKATDSQRTAIQAIAERMFAVFFLHLFLLLRDAEFHNLLLPNARPIGGGRTGIQPISRGTLTTS